MPAIKLTSSISQTLYFRLKLLVINFTCNLFELFYIMQIQYIKIFFSFFRSMYWRGPPGILQYFNYTIHFNT